MITEITNENFEQEVMKAEGTVLVDFYADWCGPCQMQGPIIEEIAAERPEIKVCKVNTDVAVAVAIENRISSIPTLLVVRNGEIIHRGVGLTSKSELEAILG